MSGYNLMLDLMLIGVSAIGSYIIIKLLNLVFPPFKKVFDKFINGEL